MAAPSSRLAAALALVAVAVTGCGAAATRHDVAAPQAGAATVTTASCPAAVAARLRLIAEHIYAQAVGGRNVVAVRRRLARSAALAAAVRRGDAAATRAALRPLMKNQIRRIRITRGAHVLEDLGRAPALAPVHGIVRDPAGRPVGRYVLAVAGQTAITGITHTITGAAVVVGRRVDATTSFAATAYPAGTVRIGLRIARPAPVFCAPTAAGVDAAVLRAAGRRLFATESRGAATRRALRHVAADRGFRAAVAAGDPAAVRAAIVRFFGRRSLHVVRVRVSGADGRLINDVGGPFVLAPASRVLRRADGRLLGRVTLSVQDDAGYIKLMHRFTGAGITLSTAAGTVPGAVPVHGRPIGTVTYTVGAFPAGALRVRLSFAAPA